MSLLKIARLLVLWQFKLDLFIGELHEERARGIRSAAKTKHGKRRASAYKRAMSAQKRFEKDYQEADFGLRLRDRQSDILVAKADLAKENANAANELLGAFK